MDGPEPPRAGPPPDESEGRIGPAIVLFLAGLTLFAVALVLEPLATYALFGSDTGEYFRLTHDLVTTGHLPTAAYTGWGSGYPDFPGIFLLAGAGAGALAVDPLSALTVIVPVTAALGTVPLFLLFRRLLPRPILAVLGAGVGAVFMPHLFSIAHPAPLALGDFFVIVALWCFVEGRRDARWYGPLAVVSGALVVTHHLSSYFLLVSALGGLLLLELWHPGSWSNRFPAREFVFLAAFAAVVLAYWFLDAPQFLSDLAGGLPGLSAAWLVPAEAAALAGVAVSALLVRWRRRRGTRHRFRFRYPSDRSLLRDALLIGGAEVAGIASLTVVPLPGTTQTTVGVAIAFFAPLLATVVLATGSRRLLTSSRLGPFALTWLAALGLSAVVAIASGLGEFSPARHAEYLLLPTGLLVAVGFGHLAGRWAVPRGRRAVVAAGVAAVVLLGANAAIAYPPPTVFGGFEEGLTAGDATLWLWVGLGVPGWATIASDHRLSSMVFGFDGNPATWDSTGPLFTGTDRSAALAQLSGALAPHVERPINAVAIDGTMRTGVALDPSELAQPMSEAALGWLSAPPFVPVYENGPQVVYWVDSGSAAGA